ncbi:MAG: DNA polymerase IV [Oscillospiraceae bacterium]
MHCDLNCFFASVELLNHPELTERPVAVCGDPASRHGIILAKNQPAKLAGVQTAETIWQARRKCPDLVLLPSHHSKYHAFSKLVNEIYGRYTDLVEPFGIDESWLDVTGTLHLFGGDGRALADEIRRTVQQELGLTLSVGVSFNKIFAKLGSDYKKPDATTVIDEAHWRSIVWGLPVSDLLFVGRAAVRALSPFGIQTIGDLARFDRDALVSLLGKQGHQLHEYANGLEHEPVAPANCYEPPKSVGSGNTFTRNLVGAADIRGGISLLADNVAMRLRQCGLKCSTVQVIIRDPQFHDICRQRPLSPPSYLARDIGKVALALVEAEWNMKAPIRALTITAQNLKAPEELTEQVNFFAPAADPTRKKQETLEHTLDSIRGKFGGSAISFASTVSADPEDPPPLD